MNSAYEYINEKEKLYEENTILRKERSKLYKALLDIKEYIEKNYETHWQSDMLMEIKDMINKSLGSDSNE